MSQAWRALVEVARRVSGPQEADLNFNFNLKGAWGGDTEKGDREMGDRGKGAWGEGGGRERERQAAKATLIVALSHIGTACGEEGGGRRGKERAGGECDQSSHTHRCNLRPDCLTSLCGLLCRGCWQVCMPLPPSWGWMGVSALVCCFVWCSKRSAITAD